MLFDNLLIVVYQKNDPENLDFLYTSSNCSVRFNKNILLECPNTDDQPKKNKRIIIIMQLNLQQTQ